jgi:hypothetical protein
MELGASKAGDFGPKDGLVSRGGEDVVLSTAYSRRGLVRVVARLGTAAALASTLVAAPAAARAAECGGNIVVGTRWDYRGHRAILVDTGGLPPAITRIEYWNGRSYELVPNADNGVRYDAILGRHGRTFIFGVSTRWALAHLGWTDSVRWRVVYSC